MLKHFIRLSCFANIVDLEIKVEILHQLLLHRCDSQWAVGRNIWQTTQLPQKTLQHFCKPWCGNIAPRFDERETKSQTRPTSSSRNTSSVERDRGGNLGQVYISLLWVEKGGLLQLDNIWLLGFWSNCPMRDRRVMGEWRQRLSPESI